jgi:hypothetical protein
MGFCIPVVGVKCVTLIGINNVSQFSEFGLFCTKYSGSSGDCQTITTIEKEGTQECLLWVMIADGHRNLNVLLQYITEV